MKWARELFLLSGMVVKIRVTDTKHRMGNPAHGESVVTMNYNS